MRSSSTSSIGQVTFCRSKAVGWIARAMASASSLGPMRDVAARFLGPVRQRPLPGKPPMSASVKGFGCWPVRAGSDWAEGRRSKASRGGSRGPGPCAMGISPRGLVGGIVRGAGRRRDAPTGMPGSLKFGASGRDLRSPQGQFPRSGRKGSPALWPRSAVLPEGAAMGPPS